ncbi:MAG: TFIIB-type zinc ribbon-containing protein [Pirellulaceae bacterium]
MASDETGTSSDEPLWPEGGAGPQAYQDRAGEGAEPVYDSVENPLKLEGLSDASTDDIRAKCKVCDSTLWVKRHKAGTTVLCPDCGSEVAVPAAPPKQSVRPGPSLGKSALESSRESNRPARKARRGGARRRSYRAKNPSGPRSSSRSKGRSSFPRTQQRKWGQAPPPEPEVSAKEESKADNESTEPIDEPLHFDVDDWIKEAFKVMGSSGFWFGISMVFIGYVIYLPYLWWSLAFLPDAEAGMVVRGIAFVLTPLAWLPTIVSKSVVGSTITVDTANRCRRIESWPDLSPTGILPAVLLYMIPYLVSIFPGVLLMQFTMGIGIPAFLAIPVAMLIQAVMFSPVFLSVLRNGSPWQVFDAQNLRIVHDADEGLVNRLRHGLGPCLCRDTRGGGGAVVWPLLRHPCRDRRVDLVGTTDASHWHPGSPT